MSKNEAKIQELETKMLELETNWKRALADYKNLENRFAEEKSAMTDFANVVLLSQIVPVLDNFEMLEIHTEDEGIKLTVRDFKQVLENAGLKIIETKKGDDFDPRTMDAIDTVDGEKNKVMSIERKGYTFRNKLVRPTSVKVGKGKEE